MGLSCTCPDYDDYDGGWFFYHPEDFSILKTKRGRRCRSCGVLIKPGAECLSFSRFRHPNHDIEENIYGEGGEIGMAKWYHCARCGEMWLNLSEYKYCVPIDENVFDLLKEHWEMHNINVAGR